MNDEYLNENWDDLRGSERFERPLDWPSRDPLARILAFTLMPNHMHLIVEEIKDGGVTNLMRRIGQSMTNHHNMKYGEVGSLFQGSFRSRTISNDSYLRYAAGYVMAKNVLELYPHGGLEGARLNFDDAWKWATHYPYSSLRHYTGNTMQIIDKNVLDQMFPTAAAFKMSSKDLIMGGKWDALEFE